jgi:peptidoglycan/xylan/chitin deacetylase (PgdA/CDA1 family)
MNQIFFAIIGVVFLVVLSTSLPYAHADQNAQMFQDNTSSIVQNGPLSCNCVAFRLEYVEDHYLNNVQDAIINTFKDKGDSLTIGLLGKDIGANAKVVGLLKDRLNNNNPPIELANRGWDNLDHTQYAEDEQSASIKMSSDKISRIFGVTPTVFMPPYNKFNNDTITAVHENGIKYMSASSISDPAPYNIHNTVLFHVPQTSLITYLLEDDPFFRGSINDKALAKIRLSLNSTGFSVVSIRSEDFAVQNGDNYNNQVDATKLQSLESLLDFLKSNGIKTVTIDQIPQMQISQNSPKWTNNLYTWYQTGQISYDDVISAIDYLIEQNIIKSN